MIMSDEKKSNYPGFTEARARANKKYMEKFCEVKVRMTPDRRAEIQGYAAAHGESTNAFITRAISETMERDTGADNLLTAQALQTAQSAAQATGETTAEFISRAVKEQYDRDERNRRLTK